jgi:hypothetical protein
MAAIAEIALDGSYHFRVQGNRSAFAELRGFRAKIELAPREVHIPNACFAQFVQP